MIIRRCNKEDIDKIYSIEEASFSDPLKKETILKDLERDSYYCYGLFEEELVAFISYEKVFDEGQIISVATMPEKRRCGYGRKLFEKVCEIAKNDCVSLFTLEVRSNNTPAVSLYEALGFKRVGVRKNYYTNPAADAILMDLNLREV